MGVSQATSETRADWLIVGGGVIGMMLARELAQQGARVDLLEHGACGEQASWAGGGIVSPLYPWRYCEPVTRLAREAQLAYPLLAETLLAETGIDIELCTSGLLMLRVEDDALALDWAAQTQQPLQRINRERVTQLQPGVGDISAEALWMPDVANLRNPRLLQALRASLLQQAGVRLQEHTPVTGLLRAGSEVTGVQTAQGALHAGGVILCAGAWTGELLATLDFRLPVVPVRGQMLLFEPTPGLLERIVLADGHYLIPRADGHVLVGSTLEYVGFERGVTANAYRKLHAAAVRLLPALERVPVKLHWSGLRPGAPDGVPFMGQVGEYRNLYVSAGHFRNGLVLAPAATRFMLRYLAGEVAAAESGMYAPQSSSSAPMPSFFMR